MRRAFVSSAVENRVFRFQFGLPFPFPFILYLMFFRDVPRLWAKFLFKTYYKDIKPKNILIITYINIISHILSLNKERSSHSIILEREFLKERKIWRKWKSYSLPSDDILQSTLLSYFILFSFPIFSYLGISSSEMVFFYEFFSGQFVCHISDSLSVSCNTRERWF